MAQFRKRPVVIEAFQWTGGPDQLEDPVWIVDAIRDGRVRFEITPARFLMFIDTSEGTMTASPGDWIIRGTAGEIYPCRPEIFAAIYDEVEAEMVARPSKRETHMNKLTNQSNSTQDTDLFTASSAIISDCGRYRYRLERGGPGEGRTVVIMVNPSTADAAQDDATIRKLKGFGARNGWGRIIVGNLFAYRATDVRELGKVSDPIGPENDHYLWQMMRGADRLIVAWGPVSKQPYDLRLRWRKAISLANGKLPFSIGDPAKCGHPKHPLMLAYDTPIIEWSPPQ